MAVYFVTGNLGGGKSLMSVARIQEALNRKAPVATNLNLRLHHLLPHDNKDAIVYRLPDKPKLEDLEMLGAAHTSYDEKKNGLIVLDECGTWFNSRSWGDKERQPLINWLLHSRKLGWDVIFIIQNVTLVDKQARLALGEHVVYCRRTDRLNIPIVGSIFKLFWGDKLPLPRVHIGVVKYGLLPTSITVDTWTSIGSRLFMAYDTKQVFSDDYEHGLFRYLPPYYTHWRSRAVRNLRFYMRLTSIYWRKWSMPFCFAFGVIGCFLLMQYVDHRHAVKAAANVKKQEHHIALSKLDEKTEPKTGNKSSATDEAPAPDPPPDPEPVVYSLDYLQLGKRLIISFNGKRYTQHNFPYPLEWRDNALYAVIPADIAQQLNEAKAARIAAIQGVSTGGVNSSAVAYTAQEVQKR